MNNNHMVIWSELTLEQAQQINALARQVKQGQAKLDAYIKRYNRPHLVTMRWLRMQLIRLLN